MEEVVLVDEEGYARGVAEKSAVHHANTPLHLAFSCYLLNNEDHLLLTRRALGKKTWPGVWTNSCCGHPYPGERLERSVQQPTRDVVVEPRHDERVPAADVGHGRWRHGWHGTSAGRERARD